MILAGDRLLVAGPPDLFQVDNPVAALEGRSGGKLLVLSATDGGLLAEYSLDNGETTLLQASQRITSGCPRCEDIVKFLGGCRLRRR